jgi:molecular chaperone GrpE
MSDNSDHREKPVDIDLASPDGEPAAPETGPADGAAAGLTAPGDLPALAPPTAEERIACLETEKADLRDRMLRIAADFDNWKKRSRKEQADGEGRVREAVLRDFLEVADNLERATASLGENQEADAKSIRDGVDLVLRQLRSKLERYQVKTIETVGQPFDPRYHEAISQVPTADVKPGSVVHELQKGYLIGEKLLRPAMVVVATAPPDAAPATDEGKPDASSTESDGED